MSKQNISKSKSLLDKIKSNLFEMVSKKKDVIPSSKQLANYFSTLPRNTYILMPFYHLVTCREKFDISGAFQSLPFDKTLSFIDLNPVNKGRFYQISDFFENEPIGMLFYSEALDSGGFVHVFLFMDETYPNTFVNIYELNNKNRADGFLVKIAPDGIQKAYSYNEATLIPEFQMLNVVLCHYYKNPVGSFYYPIHEVHNLPANIKKSLIPPADKKFDKIILQALKNEISCHRVLIPAKLTSVSHNDFISKIPVDVITSEAKFQNENFTDGPLVYWDSNKKKFIVSDDYVPYLALLSRNINPLPAVIMGEFPIKEVKIVEAGYNELIPGVKVVSKNETKDLIKTKIEEAQMVMKNELKYEQFLYSHQEVWIGINSIVFGLLISPYFDEKDWYSNIDKEKELLYKPWTIGHVMKTGLVIPGKNRIKKFHTITEFLDFYLDILVRQSSSNYQMSLAELYCDFVKESDFPNSIPLMVPEFRYGGRVSKHKYRLDFIIIDLTTFSKIGIELSPWSTHGEMKGLKGKTQKAINNIANDLRNKEVDKMLAFFRNYEIHVLTYSERELSNIDNIFNDIKKYLPENRLSEL